MKLETITLLLLLVTSCSTTKDVVVPEPPPVAAAPVVAPITTEWECSNTKYHNFTSLVPHGGVMVPLMRTESECVEWRRKP